MPFDFACPDWEVKLKRGETPMPDLPLDDQAADQAAAIFDKLCLPDVIGQPSLGEAAGQWNRDIVRACFGSIEPATGIRLVGEIFCLVPKKNGKTTMSAAIALVFMLLNRRQRADLLIIGPTQINADLAFEQAKGMIEADPEGWLSKRFHVQDHKKAIVCRVTKATLRVRTFAPDVMTGQMPVFVLLDEVHLLGSKSKAAEVIRQIRGGFLPFPESLFIMITTQSEEPPAGVFRSELAYARGVRDGRITESVVQLPILYEFSEDMQRDDTKPWLDPQYWHMVTPNLDRSVTIDGLLKLQRRAEEDGPEAIIGWATQHLNVQVGLALHTDRWVGVDYWPGCAEPDGLTLDDVLERSEVATIGFDGGGLDDLAGLAVCGRCAETRALLYWFKVWCQTDVLERRKEIAPKLKDFKADGDLVICPDDDPERDMREIVEICEKVQATGLLPESHAIGLDTYGVADLVDALIAADIPEDMLVGVPQGFKLASAILGLERQLKAGKVRHGGRPIMDWVVSNAKSETRGSNVYVTKQAAGKAKIDPLIAAFNAFQLMARNPVASGGKVGDWLKNPVVSA